LLTQNGDLLISNPIIKILTGFIGPNAGVTLARFLVGKQNGGQQSKNENHKNNIKNVFTKWSELQIIESRNKNPFYKNLYIDVLKNIKFQ
jgi:hypothetical protein